MHSGARKAKSCVTFALDSSGVAEGEYVVELERHYSLFGQPGKLCTLGSFNSFYGGSAGRAPLSVFSGRLHGEFWAAANAAPGTRVGIYRSRMQREANSSSAANAGCRCTLPWPDI